MNFDKIKNFFSGGQAKNELITPDTGRDFLRYGSRQRAPIMQQDWTLAQMSDREFYSGYSYAAINNRANKMSQLAVDNLRTKALQPIMDAAKQQDVEIVHPYLQLIEDSEIFTPFEFWYAVSTYLDLEGVYYLMAVRTVTPSLVGEIQYFQMLNPYNITRVLNEQTQEVGGYIENRNGLQREIPREMIIEVRKLNPFDINKTFSMTDAAKEYQFTLKQASDYTRSSLKNNITAPGIIGTEVNLDAEKFANFRERVLSQEKGSPLFGNGSGAITWTPMQIDMDKAALGDINSINRDTLFAVSGVSKTTMGIEESGTTRETSRIQKDKITEDQIMPQLQLVIDALNQDYKTYYKKDYADNNYKIYIDSPLSVDKDSEIKDITIATSSFNLYATLINDGYDKDEAAKYAQGKIGLQDLSDPTPPEILDPDSPSSSAASSFQKKQLNEHKYIIDGKWLDLYFPSWDEDDDDYYYESLLKDINELGDVVSANVSEQAGALQNSAKNIENQIVSELLKRMFKRTNAFDDKADLTETQKRDFAKEFALAIEAFYITLFQIYGNSLLRNRASEFGTLVSFKITDAIEKEIRVTAYRAASSHVSTVTADIMSAANKVYREIASGASEQQLISAITSAYQDISQTRAKTIARNEASRAFNASQYQADIQFLNSTDLMGKAYKQWETRSEHPCGYCQSLEGISPIPFQDNFVDLGGELTSIENKDGKTKVSKLPVNYEAINAGNAHVNCQCTYKLIIRD